MVAKLEQRPLHLGFERSRGAVPILLPTGVHKSVKISVLFPSPELLGTD